MKKTKTKKIKSQGPATPETFHSIVIELLQRILASFNTNLKLGPMFSFSIPPLITCPGKTALCSRVCYALWLYKFRKVCKKSWDRNLVISQRPDFNLIITKVLKYLPPGLFRLYVSGDIFSSENALAWLQAFRDNPHLAPFAFTKSWRDPEIYKTIMDFGWPKWLLASTDDETGPAPEGLRVAHMSDIKKMEVKKKKVKAPALSCDQQLNKDRTCAACGRCPTTKFVGGEFKQLPVVADKRGVLFLLHR